MLGQVSTTTIALLIGGVTAILLYLLWLWLRNPVLMKLGLRNLARRRAQSVLIVIGLTLSTVIVISALGVGDTLRYSVQRQAVSAYGRVDEIIAPPLLSMMASLANPNVDPAEAEAVQEAADGLLSGGIDSVLALAQGGLPSIDTARLEQLRADAASEPLIDGVAGAIVFPTIIRNVNSGQSEPLGFIFAVDNDYPQNFGLTAVDGRPLTMEGLEPGVGNIFAQASSLLAVVPALTEQFSAVQTQFGGENGITVDSVGVLQALAGLGALLTGVDPASLPALEISLDTLDQLGVNTRPLRNLGRESLTLQEVATLLQALPATDVLSATTGVTGSITIPLSGIVTGTAAADAGAALQVDPSQLAGGDLDALTSLAGDLTGDLLQAINLNTLGYQLDATLAQFGLQLRQGEIYLNRLGADRLGAHSGDLLEIYIGPLPVRFRVAAVVDQAGPLSALTPVVMLRMDEAQQLLFMPDKVNSVLVSNIGDEMTGMAQTDAVSRRLRVLALDNGAVATISGILAQPAVRTRLDPRIAELPESAQVTIEDEDVPPVLASFIEGIIAQFNVEQMSRQQAVDLLAAVDGNDNSALRESLAQPAVREWLLTLDLPAAVAGDFATAVANLNQFEQIEPLNKSTIVAAANIGGGIFSSIFSIFGVFSILAALLLIVLIFVMLAAERRVEIGVSRAIGVQRRHIVQMFMAEGMVYNLAAAALGVVLGIGITFAMTSFIGRLFNDISGTISSQAAGIFQVSFAMSWESIVIAYCLGVLITWAAMTFTSWRVTRMNIATAIRDLPDEAEARRRSWFASIMSWLWPLLVLGGGGYLLWQALTANSLSLLMIGATVTLYGLAVLVGRILELTPLRNETGYRIVYTLLGVGLLLIWIPPWYTLAPQWLPGRFTWDPTQAPTVFTIGGPMIILGAILVIMFNAQVLSAVIGAILGFVPSLRPVLRTAIAYPLSARFRTGMTMLLFAMIMATVVVMAVVINTTQSLTRMDVRETAGFDIRVAPTLLSFFSPVDDFAGSVARVQTSPSADPLLDQISAVALITDQTMDARVENSGAAYRWVNLSGVSNGYFEPASAIYRFQARAPGYADDAAIWQALATRDDVVVVKPSVLETPAFRGPRMMMGGGMNEGEFDDDDFGPRGRRFSLGDVVTGGALPELYLELTTDGQDGVTRNHRVQVIGVLAEEMNLAGGALIGSENALRVLRSVPVTGDETYVKVAPGADARAVAAAIEGAFVASGLDATVLADSYAQRQQLTGGALQLLQGFMALGLLVGIAALGVISTRAVIERRQQVGMLRALGYQRGMVGLSFVLESSFVSITGLVIGAITGVVLGDNLITAFFPQIGETVVTTPWLQISLIVLAAYAFSLLTTILPAWQAARIYPAEALRYE
jgi:putative ABC transport system permease protein